MVALLEMLLGDANEERGSEKKIVRYLQIHGDALFEYGS